MNRQTFAKALLIVFATITFIACEKEDKEDADVLEARANRSSITIPNISVYALQGTRIDVYMAQSPESVSRSLTISGLAGNEQIVAIDFRPANGGLYGITNTGQLYTINKTSGAATKVGTAPVNLTDAIVTFDFNPTVDRIRLMSGSGQNFRLHPETGAVVATDGNVNGQPGARLAGSAYTNNVAGATTTTLFNIDLTSNQLFRQVPPNDGTQVVVGSLGLTVSGEGGFDIAPNNNDFAMALFQERGKPTLMVINLMTGKATPIAKYTGDKMYTAFAIPTME